MTTVKLDKPIATHDGDVTEYALRPPTAGDFLALGDPTALVYGIDGRSALPMDDMGTIRAYAERLISPPMSYDLLAAQGSLEDGRRLVAAIKGFFEVGAKN